MGLSWLNHAAARRCRAKVRQLLPGVQSLRRFSESPPLPPGQPPPPSSPAPPVVVVPPVPKSTGARPRAQGGAELSRRLEELAKAKDESAVDAAKLQAEAAEVCDAVARRLRVEGSTFRSKNVVRIVTAACKLSQRSPPLLEAVAGHVLRGMVAYPLFALCNIANGFARLEYRHKQLMDTLAAFLAEPQRAEQLSPVDVASLVFAYAQLAHSPRSGLLEACAQTLKNCSLEVGGPNCAIILNSYARLGECNPVLFGILSRSVVQTKPESFDVHHISLIMNAYAKCQVRKPQMMHLLGDYLTGRVAEMTPQNVSNVVHAFARLECYNHGLFHNLTGRVTSEDLGAYKLYELAVLSHNLAKLKVGAQQVYGAMFGALALRSADVWEPKTVAQVLDALRRRSAFVDEQLLALLFRRFFERLPDYAVHPLTQASWCLVELDALDLAADLPPELLADGEETPQGNVAARRAMRRVLERLEALNEQQAFTPTQRVHVQQLLRSYNYRHELDHGLQPPKVKSFCKSQFDVSTSVVKAVVGQPGQLVNRVLASGRAIHPLLRIANRRSTPTVSMARARIREEQEPHVQPSDAAGAQSLRSLCPAPSSVTSGAKASGSEQRLLDLENEVSSQALRIRELESQLKNADSRTAKAKSLSEARAQDLETSSMQLRALQAEVLAKATSLKELEGKLRAAEALAGRLEDDLSAQGSQLKSSGSELRAVRDVRAADGRRVAELEEKVSSLTRRLHETSMSASVSQVASETAVEARKRAEEHSPSD
ncbi:unnamed protein product, partial [Polarella glacialis]